MEKMKKRETIELPPGVDLDKFLMEYWDRDFRARAAGFPSGNSERIAEDMMNRFLKWEEE
jgi:hypothetical protein